MTKFAISMEQLKQNQNTIEAEEDDTRSREMFEEGHKFLTPEEKAEYRRILIKYFPMWVIPDKPKRKLRALMMPS